MTSSRALFSLLSTLACAAPLAAQNWSPRSVAWAGRVAGAFDPVRQRPILLATDTGGSQSQMLEFGPRGWQVRGGLPPDVTGSTQHLLVQPNGRLLGIQGLTQFREFDGVRWSAPSVTNQLLPGAWLYAEAFDAAGRTGFVFGGSTFSGPFAVFDAAYSLQGGVWSQVPVQSPWPSARYGASMCFDAARQRFVLVGGVDAQLTTLGDTWDWNGSSWQQFAGPGPTATSRASFAFDPVTQACYRFGGEGPNGLRDETWRFDGAQWTQVGMGARPGVRGDEAALFATPFGIMLVGGVEVTDTWLLVGGQFWVQVTKDLEPSVRTGAAVTLDTARGEFLVCGGLNSTFGQVIRDDFWIWRDGWRQPQTATTVPWRFDAAMAFDRARGEAVLFGGSDRGLGSPPNDTWIWNGTDWAQRITASAPSARTGHRLSYDAARSRVVLFGGRSWPGQNLLNETWEWDGVNWLQRSPATSPPAREHHQQAFDAATGQTIVFGPSSQFADMWLYDGANWVAVAPTQLPLAPVYGCAFDERLGQVVALSTNAEWRWNGADWARVARSPAPMGLPSQDSSSVVYDPRRQCRWLFAQDDFGAWSQMFADTPVVNSVIATGNGCAATGDAVPDLITLGRPVVPSPDFTFAARATGTSTPMVLAIGLAPNQAPLGGGCSLLVDNVFFVVIGVSDSTGFGEVVVAVPDRLFLRGVTIHAQAFAAQPNGLGVSRALRIVLGD